MNYNEVLKCLKMPNYVSNDFYSMLFARSIGEAAGYGELTGTPPLTFTANGENLLDYRIYGASDGVGERTENLFDYKTMSVGMPNYYLAADGTENQSEQWTITDYIPCDGSNFVLSKVGGKIPAICGYNAQKEFVGGQAYNTGGSGDKFDIYVIFGTDVKFIRFSYYSVIPISPNNDDVTTLMLTAGSTAPAQYIPFGYQINAEVGDSATTADTPIYVGDTQLAQGEYVDYGEQKVYKYVGGVLTPTDPPVALPALPTIDGETIVDFDNTPKPSEMYIKYPK